MREPNHPSRLAVVPGGVEAGAAGAASVKPQAAPHLARLARYFSPRPRRPLPFLAGNDVRLLVNGNECYAAMLAAMLTARKSIDIEIYIWHADVVGRRFAELLKAKAAEGVAVRVIYDSVGCLSEPRGFWRQLSEAGVRVAPFNPLRLWPRSRPGRYHRRGSIFNRDHRKIIVIDGEIAFTGGVNIGDEYAGHADDVRHWRDTSVRITGPLVARLAQLFQRQWQRVAGEKAAVEPLNHPPATGQDVAIVLNSRPFRINLIRRAIFTAVRRARRRIEITMAYFLPPPRLVRLLRRAARRGVEVVLLLPSQSDVPAAFHAGRSYYDRLLRAGVRIFECQGTVLHAKTIAIDGVWATVGSSNLDLRSLRLNHEANVFVLGRPFARHMHEVFQADLARSREIVLDAWRRRGWSDRLQEWFFRFFRPWL